MAVGQLPDEVREFATYLSELMARLDQDDGWCGVFWSRDPDGMRACLEGAEVPPWDVVQALLHDLAADSGVGVAHAETGRARALHAASAAAYDDRPGGRELLSDRLDLMLQEQRFALERQQELARALAVAATPDEVDRIHLDLAWVRDDHDRAAARCGELRARMERLDRTRAPQWVDFGGPGHDGVFPSPDAGEPPGDADRPSPAADGYASSYATDQYATDQYATAYATDAPDATDDHAPAGRPTPAEPAEPATPTTPTSPSSARAARAARSSRTPRVPRQSGPRRRPRGARFAGIEAGEADVFGPLPAPATDEPPTEGRTPRGARYAQAMDAAPRAARRARTADAPTGEGADARGTGEPAPARLADERATTDAVKALIRLRGEGRSGEAHGVLVEAAGWPAARLPLFAEELHHAGLAADWATLLWEAASLPPDRLVAVADALAGAGRAEDCRKLLRQGVARPAPEIAESLIALADAGREREARALLDAYVRVRSAEDVAACAHTDPPRLIPQLLEAAKAASDEHHWDLVHALRVAGFTT
ncbi:hypothetical protein GCM10010252_40960 [Streptomyces aureoverticillatus]|nr:hypothetical protein GCM10010252_40960 [Streptomyces aureoverticillatus]